MVGRGIAEAAIDGGVIRQDRTLCRPPEIGSSFDEAKDSNMSQAGFSPGTCPARAIWKAASR